MGKKKFVRKMGRTVLVVIATMLLGFLLSLLKAGNESIIMVYLLGVLFVAVLTSNRRWAIVVAIIFDMIFNFFYTPPIYSFLIYKLNDVILLIFFVLTAIGAGTITLRLQKEIELAERNEHTAVTLYKISSGFLAESGENRILDCAENMFTEYASVRATIRLSDNASASGSAEKSYDITGSVGKIGCVSVYTEGIDDRQDLIIRAICTQLGIALDRERLIIEREKIRLAMEKEKQRSLLLRSIGHDLRSPLTALSGAGNLLSDSYDDLTDTERRKLAGDVSEESLWLTDLVENIINMTRISESRLLLNKNYEVIDDVITEVVKHTERLFKGRTFKVTLPDHVVAAVMDGKLIAQVLINLMENAVRHTPADSKIEVRADTEDGFLRIAVADNGDGVPKNIRGRLFEQYFTQDNVIADGQKGLGLGLPICKTIVNAHDGKIWYEENHPKGSVFIFTIPLEEAL